MPTKGRENANVKEEFKQKAGNLIAMQTISRLLVHEKSRPSRRQHT